MERGRLDLLAVGPLRGAWGLARTRDVSSF